MLEVIKEMGIFIVIAQAILYLVPGESYAKYVKVIIGILMIAQIARPVLAFTSAQTLEEILSESQVFTEQMTDWEEHYQIEVYGEKNR